MFRLLFSFWGGEVAWNSTILGTIRQIFFSDRVAEFLDSAQRRWLKYCCGQWCGRSSTYSLTNDSSPHKTLSGNVLLYRPQCAVFKIHCYYLNFLKAFEKWKLHMFLATDSEVMHESALPHAAYYMRRSFLQLPKATVASSAPFIWGCICLKINCF